MVNAYEPIPKKVEEIATITIDAAFKVHSILGPGLLESAYEACLTHELRNRGIDVKTQVPMPIEYMGLTLDEGYRIDVLVDNCVIVKVKSVDTVLPVHKAQILTYLKFSKHRIGFLINFNSRLIKNGIDRVVL